MNLKVLAIDPGENVGWASGVIDTVAPRLMVERWGIATLKDFAITLATRAPTYDVIVFENYIIRASTRHTGSTVPTLQFIGMVRLAVWLAQTSAAGAPGPQLVEQAPRDKPTGRAAARVHVPELVPVIEEALALDDTGQHDEGHHGDALMHLVAYYHTNWGGKQ